MSLFFEFFQQCSSCFFKFLFLLIILLQNLHLYSIFINPLLSFYGYSSNHSIYNRLDEWIKFISWLEPVVPIQYTGRVSNPHFQLHLRLSVQKTDSATSVFYSIQLSYRSILVAKVGLEPTRSFPPRDFRNTMTFVTSTCCLCSGLYLDHIFRFRSAPSSLYTFLISKAWLGISS